MTPDTCIAKWCDAKFTKRAAAQEHYTDLRRLLTLAYKASRRSI